MSRTKNNATPLAVLIAYQKLIREYHDKYGEIASRIDKDYMYGQVARQFSITSKYAGQLIRKVLKNRKEYEGYEAEAKDVLVFIQKCKTPVNRFV